MSRAPERCDSESDHRFHRNEWRVQRIGWVLVALFLAVAVAGLFGDGPLSRAHADNSAGRLDYERFTRFGLSTDLVVTPAASTHGVTRIQIGSDYLAAVRIEHITPEPAAVRLAGPNIIYEFASATPGGVISFHITPQRLWRRSATITIDDGAPLHISQLTYP
jgi:hypothetical protein